jgi:nuclear pore complex protein Nup188
MARALKGAQRNSENAQLTVLLQSYLLLSRLVLAHKRSSPFASRQSLLEHLLCTGTSINSNSVSSPRHPKVIPIDSIANLALSSDMGSNIPIYATEMLSSLVLTFAEIQPSPPSLVTHMSDAEETVNQLVRIVSSNYEDSRLRKAIWSFMGNSVELQPALATLFVTGSFFIRPSVSEPRGDEKDNDQTTQPSKSPAGTDRKTKSALTVAVETATLWEGLWKSDPALLSAIIRFADAVWRHGLEHATALDTVRLDSSFWTRLIWIVKQGATSDDGMQLGKVEKSRYDPSIKSAYRKLAQAYAVDICAIEAGSQRRSTKSTPSSTPVGGKSKAAPPAVSLMALRNLSQVGDTLAIQLKEAMKSSLDVDLHERLAHQLKSFFPDFSLEAIQSPFPAVQRTFGVEYLYQVTLLEPRLIPEMTDRESSSRLRQLLNDAQAVNCNWSIVDAEIEYTRAWKQFLQEGGASMQSEDKAKIELFQLSISMSETIAKETRKGKTMTIIHTERLGALLALLESTWSLSLAINKDVSKQFSKLLRNVHAIVMSDVFPPIESLRESASGEGTGFHRHVLRIAYFCTRKARTLFERGQTITAEQNAIVASTMLSITGLVSTALSEAIDAAKTQPNIEVDRDMELLVTVFEQCTRPELHTSPRLWLERVQELNLARSSLELLTKCDIGGDLMDGEVLRTYRHPLYARHMLALQLCLASMEAPAETLAISGAISAYSNISIANDLTVGTLNALHPELPGERNPGQQAWCNLLAIVTALVGTVGRTSNHFIETEITSFIQLYGAQISRALEWNVGQPLSSATLEELEAVMRLFNAISMGVNPRSAADIQAQGILQTFAEKGLTLIQHVNYALSHPNHFASLFEAITADERRALDREVGQTPTMASVYELLDAEKRPFVSSLTQRTHVIVRDILCTLVIVNQGDEVVTGEPEDWPTVVQVAPVSDFLLYRLFVHSPLDHKSYRWGVGYDGNFTRNGQRHHRPTTAYQTQQGRAQVIYDLFHSDVRFII